WSAYAEVVTTTGQHSDLPPGSPMFSRIATTAAAAVLVVLAGSVIADLPGRSPAVIAGAVTALLVCGGCGPFLVLARSESARLAREIHDILAHALSGLVLALDTMELLGRQGTGQETMTKMAEQVARAQRIARDGLADTRRAIAALRGEELPGPALLDQL